MIAVTIVHAYEDYIKDRNQLGERGKFLNRKFINEAELWLFENKGTEPLSLHWCCEMLDISKWKIRKICKKQREEKIGGVMNKIKNGKVNLFKVGDLVKDKANDILIFWVCYSID
ncbi:hypothetical protein IID10_17220 [candidate division KSB1 bacterium]|nr:hypothetical protein [candidate division KSB1 bacterium]